MIIKYNKILHKISKQYNFNIIIKNIINKAINLCKNNNGIGLSFCQIGININIYFILIKKCFIFKNIKKIWISNNKIKILEGCLSKYYFIYEIKNKYIILQKKKKIFIKGILSIISLHEINHINGITI